MEKITKGHPLSQSADIVKENLETLKRLFPTIVKEGKIDVEELKALLDEDIETNEEYYRFTWAGKNEARREANKPSTATLRPCKEESKNWETTGNIFIEGDNLEVLKLLQKSYAGKIKMMYFDPPYNTGKDFVYKDNYTDNLSNYLSLTGQTDEEGKKLSTNTESDGRYHSNWLNMMYPRLKLARNLLTDDGVVFISIDENEINNLRKLCNEVFGEENFVAQFVWAAGKKNDSKLVSVSHEYIVCYLKNKTLITEQKIMWRVRKKGLSDIYSEYNRLKKIHIDNYSKISEELKKWYKELPNDHPAKRQSHYSSVDFRGIYFPDNISWPGGGGPKYDVFHPVTKKKVGVPSRGWMFTTPERMQEFIDDDRVHFGTDENSVPCIKSYLKDREFEVPYSVFYQDGRASTKRLRAILGGDYFEHPKDEFLLKEIIEFSLTKNSIILDFFAGSGTTAHSVMLQNSVDGGNRKFICVQIPEPTDEKSEAYKAGFVNISNLCKARILKTAITIEEELKAKVLNEKKNGKTQLKFEKEEEDITELSADEILKYFDSGFKVFKLDSSNITAWDGNAANLQQNLFNSQNNIKLDRSEDDILYEVLLKYGLDLTVPIEEKTVHSCKVFSIGGGVLFVCLSDKITIPVAETIGKWKEELQPATCRALFKDNGFADDIAKTNSIQILRQYGIEEANSI